MFALRVKRLYSGTDAPAIDRAILVYDGENIIDVIPDEGQEYIERLGVNVSGEYADCVMTPGLIDVHVHLMLPGDGTLGEDLMARVSPGEIQILAYRNSREALAGGVTTMRDVGAALDVDLSLRAFYRNTGEIGPTILCCGKPVTCTGGHCHYMGGTADCELEIKKLIRGQQARGTDWVKVMATAGGTRGISPGDPFSPDELAAAVNEAHRQHMRITMHASRIDGLRKVAASAPDGIEHCQFTDGWEVAKDKALAETICRNGTRPCHTMAVNVSIIPFLKDKPEELWTDTEREFHAMQLRWMELGPQQLAFQLSQGVPTIGGSDAGWRWTSFRDGMALSMEMMERAGMSPVRIINACTGAAADYLGIGDVRGTLKPGMKADLLLLNSDPESSISAFRSIKSVYKNGIKII